MAVLVEGISVIIRCSAVRSKYRGGEAAFRRDLPNRTFCTDGELARVGFMQPEAVRSYVRHLERRGLTFRSEQDEAVDIAVMDQLRGPLVPCCWLERAYITMNDRGVGRQRSFRVRRHPDLRTSGSVL